MEKIEVLENFIKKLGVSFEEIESGEATEKVYNSQVELFQASAEYKELNEKNKTRYIGEGGLKAKTALIKSLGLNISSAEIKEITNEDISLKIKELNNTVESEIVKKYNDLQTQLQKLEQQKEDEILAIKTDFENKEKSKIIDSKLFDLLNTKETTIKGNSDYVKKLVKLAKSEISERGLTLDENLNIVDKDGLKVKQENSILDIDNIITPLIEPLIPKRNETSQSKVLIDGKVDEKNIFIEKKRQFEATLTQ